MQTQFLMEIMLEMMLMSPVQRRFNEMGLLLQFEHGHPILPLNFDLFNFCTNTSKLCTINKAALEL